MTTLAAFDGGRLLAIEYNVLKRPSQEQVYLGEDPAAAVAASDALKAAGLKHAIITRQRLLFDGVDA